MNRRFSLTIVVVLISVALNAVVLTAQDNADKAAIKKLVEQFFDAYRKKDLDGVMACWSANSPMSANFKQFAQIDFIASEETQFVNVSLTGWRIEADHAFVRLRFERKWRDATTKQSSRQTVYQEVLVAKEAGGWKFLLQTGMEIPFVERLEAARSKEERAQLLKDEKGMVTADLLSLLVMTGAVRASMGQIDSASKLNEISFEVADALGGIEAKGQCYLLRATILLHQSKYLEALTEHQRAAHLFRQAKSPRWEGFTLNSIGGVYGLTGRYAEALSQFEAALKIAQGAGDKPGEATALASIGLVYQSTGRYAEALEKHEASLRIARQFGNRLAEAATLDSIGGAYRLRGRYAEALEKHEESLRIAQETGDRSLEAKVRANIGVVYGATGRYPESLIQSEASLSIAREMGDRSGEASALGNIGNIYRLTGNYTEALKKYEASLSIAREIGSRPVGGTALSGIGLVYQSTGQYPKALGQFEASLSIAREMGDRSGEASALGVIGMVYALTGRYAEALEKEEVSLSIVREIGDKPGEASALGSIGVVYQLTGRYAEALNKFEENLRIAREMGDRPGEAAALGNIGNIHQLVGNYAEALEKHEESLRIARGIGNMLGESAALVGIGLVYQAAGRYAESLNQLEASLKINREVGNRAGEASTLGNIGIVYALTGRYAEALEKHEADLKIAREIGDKTGEAAALDNIGFIYHQTGKYEEALSQFKASLKVARETGDKTGEAIVLGGIGVVYQATGRYAEALNKFEESLKIAREIGNKMQEARSLTAIASVYRSQKQWRQAADTYQKAIPIIELIRTHTKEPSLQTSFFAQYTFPYYGLIESLLELKSTHDEIFAVSERAKARTLVELMTGGRVNVLKFMTPAERQQEQKLKANFIAASAQLNAASSASPPDQRRVDELKQQMNKARDDYADFRVKLFIAHPELQVQRASYDPLALAQLSEPLFAEDPDLCLLSYLVGDDKVFLFVITRGQNANVPVNLNVYTLKADKNRELTASELKERLSEFRRRAAHESGPHKQLARGLYESLLAPARNELKGRGHVVIIPDGMLYALPFQALVDKQGKHFAESHTVSYAPSVTALIKMMKLAEKKKKSNTNTQPLFAMGRGTFPDQVQYRNLGLPKAEEQVESIARLFGVTPRTGAQATKAKAILEMGATRYVHFATHGELNEVAPMESAIVLGKSADDDGMLYARELLDMDLQAELVVLSACDTGLGQPVSGEGILGLTWALFVAGTPTSVVTQWKVRDDSMNKLMLEFYRQMRQATSNGHRSISKAEALRRAQLSLIKDNAYKHPYHWAPVVLVGDWR